MNNIRKDIKENNLNKVYLLLGEEEYLRDYYTDLILNAVCSKEDRDFSYLKISYTKPTQGEVEEFTDSYPFLGGGKLLYIKESGLFKKTTEAEKKFFKELIENLPDYITIVFSETEADKRNALYKAVSEMGYVCQMPYQKKQDVVLWATKLLKGFGKTMDDKDIEYLIELCPKGMLSLKAELEKLASYKKENPLITRGDIDTLVAPSLENRVFAMAENMIKGNTGEALKMLEELKTLKSEPIAITGAIYSKFSQYSKLKTLSHRTIYEISAKTGQKEYFVKNDLNLIKNTPGKYINTIIQMCNKTNHRILTGRGIPWSELELLVGFKL